MMEPKTATGNASREKTRWLSYYRMISLGFSVVFALVGFAFLLFPGAILRFFDGLSGAYGLESSSVEGIGFYLILAVGYMYLVALLAWFMFRQPENDFFPLLLLNAKSASSLLSLIFFFGVSHALIYLTNGIVDGIIATGVLLMIRKQRRMA